MSGYEIGDWMVTQQEAFRAMNEGFCLKNKRGDIFGFYQLMICFWHEGRWCSSQEMGIGPWEIIPDPSKLQLEKREPRVWQLLTEESHYVTWCAPARNHSGAYAYYVLTTVVNYMQEISQCEKVRLDWPDGFNAERKNAPTEKGVGWTSRQLAAIKTCLELGGTVTEVVNA